MPRTARRPGPPSYLFGIWGQGDTAEENIDALLSEHIEGLGEITPKFLIPLDKEITTDTQLAVVTFAEKNNYDVEVVQAAAPRTKALREVKDLATKIHEADDADNPIEKVFADALAAKGENGQLLFLWAEDDDQEPLEDDQRVLFACLDAGTTALDLTSGLDALGAAEPEEESTAAPAKKAPTKAAAKDPEPAADGEEPAEPAEEIVREWPLRRLRSFVLQAAAAEREVVGVDPDDVPSDEDIKAMDQEALLKWLYPPEDDGETTPEPEPEADPEAPRSARQLRKAAEAAGEDTMEGSKKALRAAQEPAEGDPGGSTALDDIPALIEAVVAELGHLLADTIIDRIAARIESEPEGSATRKEIAPPRPPGKPRGDGAAPTRRRTRA